MLISSIVLASRPNFTYQVIQFWQHIIGLRYYLRQILDGILGVPTRKPTVYHIKASNQAWGVR